MRPSLGDADEIEYVRVVMPAIDREPHANVLAGAMRNANRGRCAASACATSGGLVMDGLDPRLTRMRRGQRADQLEVVRRHQRGGDEAGDIGEAGPDRCGALHWPICNCDSNSCQDTFGWLL